MKKAKTDLLDPRKPWAILPIYLFLIFLFFVFPLFNIIYLTDPFFSKFDSYHRLFNWDLKQHAKGDYDLDGKEDFITFWGCAFFSATNVEQVPQQEKCISTSYEGPGTEAKKRVGIKYFKTSTYDLGFDSSEIPYHSYLGKYDNERWSIYLSHNGLKRYEISELGTLQEKPITFANKMDEVGYVLSHFSFLPLVFLPFYLVFATLATIFIPLVCLFFLIKIKRKKS